MQKFSIGIPIQPTEKSLTFAAKIKNCKKQKMKNYILIPLLALLTTGLRAQENKSYRPFVEDGKVWTIGWISKDRMKLELLEYYYFDGDTVINHQPCKRMMSRMTDEIVSTYQGAFYEKDRRVYCCFPNSEDFYLLYDYGAEVGDTIKVYAPVISDTISCVVIIIQPQKEEDCFKGVGVGVVDMLWKDELFLYVYWIEGVGTGTIPYYNTTNPRSLDYYYNLITCSVGDEVLFQETSDWNNLIPGGDSSPFNPDDNNNPKKFKQKIDFTHVIKKQPKREGETVAGSFDSNRLLINLQDAFDLYTVTITDSLGQVVYAKQVQTNNVLALNIDTSDLLYSDYNITVENDEHIFDGHFYYNPTDYDGDRILTLNDITTLINIYLTDEDGLVTVSDVTALLEIYLNKDKE